MQPVPITLEQESAFIHAYATAPKKSRFLELHASKRRHKFTDALVGFQFLDECFVYPVSTRVSNADLLGALKKLGALETVRVVSDKHPEGAEKALLDAVQDAQKDFGTLIFYSNDNAACCIGEYGMPILIVPTSAKVERIFSALS